MRYAKIENGQVTQVDLPTIGILTQGENAGCTVSGYNLLSADVLKAEGWLPLVDNPPEYNQDTEYLGHGGYTAQADKVIANYVVKQREVITPQPTLEQQIADLQIAMAGIMGGAV